MEVDTGSDFRLDRYWKRRAAVLGGMLGAVGLMAWACGAGGGSEKKEPVRNAGAVDSSAPARPTAMPTVTVTTTVSPEPREDGQPCRERDLVFNVAPSGTSFGPGSDPRFRVTVVNTGHATCTFDVGSLSVAITSGKDRIWSSDACAKQRPEKRTLRRGIPYADDIVWNRHRGCGDASARPGTYVAALKGGKADRRVLHLR
jgi:hypothetical protein